MSVGPTSFVLQTESSSLTLTWVILLILVAVIAYMFGKQRELSKRFPKDAYRRPELEQLVVRARYGMPYMAVDEILEKVVKSLNYGGQVELWGGASVGQSIILVRKLPAPRNRFFDRSDDYFKQLSNARPGLPNEVSIIFDHEQGGRMEAEILVKPVMYFIIAQQGGIDQLGQHISDAQIEATELIKKIMVAVLGGTEIEPAAVRPLVRITELRSKLAQRGLNSVSELLSQADTKLIQGNPEDAVKNCRSVLEQVMEYTMEHTVGKTDKFGNDLTKLRANKKIDKWTETFISSFYSYISEDVHDRFKANPGEGKLVLQTTETVCDYLLRVSSR